jgi:hypothetical protein
MKEMEGLKRKVENDFGFNIKKWDIVKHEKNSSFVARIVTEEGKKKALKSLYITVFSQDCPKSVERAEKEPLPKLHGWACYCQKFGAWRFS